MLFMMNILKMVKSVFEEEAKALLFIRDKVNDDFAEAVQAIYDCKGDVTISGIGKSGLIGQKIVATLNSTGTRSVFLHPVEAMHGDLGFVRKEDIFIGLSNSGETSELNVILSSIKSIGCMMLSFTGNMTSMLAGASDISIDIGVEREACPLGLAPTSSTTALLAAGDALASALILKREFKKDDFKRFHPGGSLGKRLSTGVDRLMLGMDSIPLINKKTSFSDALKELDKKALGAVFVIDEDRHLMGLLTDGDVRHYIACGGVLDGVLVSEIMTEDPLSINIESPAYDALNIMEEYQITVLPVVDGSGCVQGLLHLHDILGKGELKFAGQ